MSAEFVACMEDVLDLYAEPYDPERPVVCFDETSKQLLAEKRSPIPPKPARRERYDYEYQRNGTRNLFMLCEPLAGWRHVAVTERRTMVDFAQQMRWLADEAYPASEKIRVVLDNLNTHKPASLYETFEPKEARRIRKRLEFHYTPKHGSWLNMAEWGRMAIADTKPFKLRVILHRIFGERPQVTGIPAWPGGAACYRRSRYIL